MWRAGHGTYCQWWSLLLWLPFSWRRKVRLSDAAISLFRRLILITMIRHIPQPTTPPIEGWINGGFFVFEPEVFDYLKDDSTVLKHSQLETSVHHRQLMAYEHSGYWQCMDTIRDRDALRALSESG